MYKVFELDLSKAVSNLKITYMGQYICLYSTSNNTDKITINFNHILNPAIDFIRGQAIKTNFHTLFLSWAAQGSDTGNLFISTDKIPPRWINGSITPVYPLPNSGLGGGLSYQSHLVTSSDVTNGYITMNTGTQYTVGNNSMIVWLKQINEPPVLLVINIDYTELSTTQIQFTSGLLIAGSIVILRWGG